MLRTVGRSAALIGVVAAVVWSAAAAQPQPGFVNPGPVLQAAEKAIGTANLRCVTISGGQAQKYPSSAPYPPFVGIVGQQVRPSLEWPRGERLTHYARQINFETATMKEELERTPGLNPRSWKWGWGGWIGGTPPQQHPRQIFMVNGTYAWHYDGPGTDPIPAPELAELWQLEMWLNPHGFLKAARMPGANPAAVWRWARDAMDHGPDHEVRKEKLTVVEITILGKYSVNATIDSQNLIRRIQTRIPHPVHGDLNYEHEFSSYQEFGGGVKFPIRWHHHQGLDDDVYFQPQSQQYSGGHNTFGGTLDRVQPNVCSDPVAVPESVRRATIPPVHVDITELARGVYLLGGGTHNSVAVEFNNFVTVIEAPLDERRSLAVIEEVVKRIPNKPIRFVVNTHFHYDHIGGLRTYQHIGATIVTHFMNVEFYRRDVLTPAPRMLQPDLVSRMPPTEMMEGYVYQPVSDEFVISDRMRHLHIYWVRPLAHADGMLMAYLPQERLLIEADLLDTHVPLPSTPTPAHRSLYSMVQALKLDVSQVVPIHGQPVPWKSLAFTTE